MTTQARMLPAVAAGLLFAAASLWGQQEAQKRPREDQEARARHRFIQRMDERGEIAPGALINAKKELDLQASMQRADGQTETAGISSWEWLGPGNIGGRIRSFVFHPTNPNRIWIGSASGGIWRTDNGGGSWSPVNDFMANLAVTSLAVDPTNANVLYAGTGEGFGNLDARQGAGLFRSVDGGVTWSQLSSTSSWTLVNRVAHHPDSSGVLLAIERDLGLRKSTNGGLSWRHLLTISSAGADVKYHPDFPNHVMVGTAGMTRGGTYYPGEVYYSTDYGTSFVKQTTGLTGKLPASPRRCEVAFAPSTLLQVYVSVDVNGGQLWRGSFGGTSWTLVNTGNNFLGGVGWYANAIWVDPVNPDHLITGGVRLFRSIDGGTTLTQISNGAPTTSAHDDQHWIVHDPGYNGGSNKTVYFANDGGLFKTPDVSTVSQNSGWISLNNDLGITQFYGGAISPDGSIVLGGTQDNDIPYKLSGDPPQFWRKRNDWCCDGGFAAVDYNNPNTIYSETQNFSFMRSDNGGQSYSWKVAGLLDAGQGPFIAPFSMDPNNPHILVAGGKRIWRTTTRADDWTSIRDSFPTPQSCSTIDIAKGNSAIIWVAYELGTVSYTTNTGATWTNVDGALPNRYVTDIAINPFNSDEVFVTIGGYTDDQLWLTTDRGASWTDRTGTFPFDIPSVQVNTVRYHPGNPNWVYVGSDLGVFASEDKGLHWRILPAYPGNDGPANVAVDELFWQGGEALIAATHGRGMYRARLGIYVAGDSPTPPGVGTQANPFTQIQLGINAMGNGEPLIFAPWDYQQGPLTFNRRGWLVAPNGAVTIR